MKLNPLLGFLAFGLAQPANAETAPVPPPYEGYYQPQGVDEIGLWQQDDEDERQLTASPVLIRDDALTSYVKGVLCETVGDDRCSTVRIYIIHEPTFNATMSPNGTMRVFSGLLLRARNEAELGAVLGHEFGHFEERHSLKKFQANRSGSDLLAWGALLANTSLTYQANRSYQNMTFSVYGNLYQYGRDQEREADMLGVSYLNKSNLPPQDAAKLWQNLMGEIEASTAARGLKKPDFRRIAFTASHPPQAERAEYLAEMAMPEGASRDNGAARYHEALAAWMPIFLQDQIKLNDFGASEYIIQCLAEDGWTKDLWFARGELYRTRGNQRDLVNAAEFYANAIAMDAGLAEAYRGLGLSLLKTGQRAEGVVALTKYLELKPDASDAGMIRMIVPKEGISN